MERTTTCCSGEGLKRGSWTEEEDQKLVSFVRLHGERDWKSLPQKAGLLRCGKSCRLRWANYLRPGIKRGAFTPEEDETIIRLHADLGNKWATIARHLKRRTDNEIKNHWNTRLKKLVAKNNPPQVVAEPELSNNNNNNNNDDNINDNNSNNDPLIFSKSSETTTYSSPSSTCCSSSTTTTTTTTNNNNSSFAQVLNSIASKTHLVNIHRVLNDTGVGSDPSNLSPRSSKAIDTKALGDEIISMEFQSLIEEFLTQSREFDGPSLDASFEVDFLDEQMGSTSNSYECDL